MDVEEPDALPSKPRRINESLQSLQTYAALIEAVRPITAREIMARTGVADGTLYPLLEKRISAGIVTELKGESPTRYDLSPAGYEVARAALLSLEIKTAAWLHCEWRFRPPK